MNKEILIVDDEKDIRSSISDLLNDEDYSCRSVADSDDALFEIAKKVPDLVLLDIWLEGSKLDGLELLTQIHSFYPHVPCIMISGHGNIDIAVKAIKGGASDFIEKPFQSERLILIIDRVLEFSRLKKENEELWIRTGGPIELIGNSNDIKKLKLTISKIAPTGSRVLIQGDAGSGKETVARLIHQKSKRANGPFVTLTSSLLTSDRMEEILFGEEDKSGRVIRFGLFEQANNGTLFIEEVSALPLEIQRTIIRVLQDQSFFRKNGNTRVVVDIRIISSTSNDLKKEIFNKKFSEDLYYRLNVVPLYVPSLKDRKGDIPGLIEFFIQKNLKHKEERVKLSKGVIGIFQSFDWPGNIRQLKNTIERIMILLDAPDLEEITVEMLPPDLLSENKELEFDSNFINTLPLKEARKIFEYEYIKLHLERFNGNVSKTAEFIGMERSALHRKLNNLTEIDNIKKS